MTDPEVPEPVEVAPTICGFQLSTEVFCYEDRGQHLRCRIHRGLTCKSCGAQATRECPAFVDDNRCGIRLCEKCVHQSYGGHSPQLTEVDLALNELQEALAVGFQIARERGLCVVPDANMEVLCRFILMHLSNHTVLKVLSGLATPPR